MRKLLPLLLAVVLFSSHDMFLKLDTFFLEPGTPATIRLFNGTFEESDNTIARRRMVDVSLIGNGTRTRLDTASWTENDKKQTLLHFITGDAGTWVAGVSTRPNDIAMDAEAFNNYLAHDGVVDMFAARKASGIAGQDAVEQYAKHVKTIFQVGDQKTGDWQTELGYPVEFVPLSNPYDLKAGDELAVKLLVDGQPATNQLVIVGAPRTGHDEHDHAHADEAGHDHDQEAADEHIHDYGTRLRTDARGVLTFPIDHEGIWHLRTIHMVTTDAPGLTHESNWATLTFEVGHGHAHGAHGHDHASAADHHDHGDGEGAHNHADGDAHDHDTEAGVPAYLFWVGSLAILTGLFFFFNRQA